MADRRRDARQELVDVIRQVRKRWRTRMLLRGGIIVLVGALVAIALASFGLQTYKFSPASVIGFRIAIFARFALLLGALAGAAARRRVSDLQVALYVEEHEPSLQAAILSAVDIGAALPTPARSTCRRSSSTSWSRRPSRRPGRLTAAGRSAAQAMQRQRGRARHARRRSARCCWSSGPEFLRQGASALLDADAERRSRQSRTRSRSRRATSRCRRDRTRRSSREAGRLPVERRRR